MRSMLRLVIEKNLFVNDFTKRILALSYNKKMSKFVEECSVIDSIEDYETFEKQLKYIPNTIMNSSYTIKRAYAENFLYGYANSIMKYAGIENKNMIYLSLLEHGIYPSKEIDFSRYNREMSYIFQGRSNETVWRMRTDFRPIYYIGPYIHYVKSYYSKARIEDLHKKNGRTLLVFPPHSTEYDKMKFSFNRFNELLFKNIGKKYDKIYACIFWKNVDDQYTAYLKANGVELVSSGFKIDFQFASRLKTILELADTVLYPSFSSSIGYAYYMEKQVIYIDNESSISWSSDYNREKAQSVAHAYLSVKTEFANAFSINAPKKTKEKTNLVNRYWGIDQIKTAQQLKNIYLKNKKYILERFGF